MISRIPGYSWGILAMLLWGAAILALGLVRFTPYGMDEGAARGLLLNWSIVDAVANPIVIFGLPDFRALFFVPLGLYWSGSIVAAKVYTLIMAFSAILLLYNWSRQTISNEAALISSALLAISPIMLTQADAIGVGPYLLLVFGLGVWLDKTYRASPRSSGGWLFMQLLLVGICVTLHPMGLAYPLALLWRWYKDSSQETVSINHRKHILVGVPIAALVLLVIREGWGLMHWWSNPFTALSMIVAVDPSEEPGLAGGIIFAALLLVIVVTERRALLGSLMGNMLLLGVLIGLTAADAAWALVALVLILYYGIPRLIAVNQAFNKNSLMGQRGLVMVVMMIAATVFMLNLKDYRQVIQDDILSPEDKLIQLLSLEAADTKQPFRAASQWPGRTMIACKRDVLPLPPPAKEGEDFLKTIKGITHLMFNPYQPTYRELGRTIAQLGGATQTLALQQGGVIVKIREVAAAATPPAAHAPAKDGGSVGNAGATFRPPAKDGESEARGVAENAGAVLQPPATATPPEIPTK